LLRLLPFGKFSLLFTLRSTTFLGLLLLSSLGGLLLLGLLLFGFLSSLLLRPSLFLSRLLMPNKDRSQYVVGLK
jgi:hypothetical protein